MKIQTFLLLVLMAGSAHATVPEWQFKVAPGVLAESAAGATDFMIEMNDQADLSAAALVRGKAEKNRLVFETLRAHAARTQAPVLMKLAELGVEYQAFWIANTIAAKGARSDLEALAAMPEVSYIHGTGGVRHIGPVSVNRVDTKADEPARGNIEPGVARVRAPEVWALGFTGQGVVVGDHDIGVLWDHAALKKQYRGWDGEAVNHDYNWLNAFPQDPFCDDLATPCDPHGHGTHTTGTMVGDDGGDNRIGMAPGAQWMACRSLLDPVVGVGFMPTYLTCMEWTLAPYPTGNEAAADPAMAPDVVNNSWGCIEGCPPTILQATNDAIKAAGIVQVVSAGNDGSECSTIAFPLSIYDSSFTVGATTVGDEMASFSSRGPVVSDLSMRLKPNVVAPGVSTRSSLDNGDYGKMSGTSMAGPHVAGLVALMLSAAPELKGEVDTVRELIEQTAVPITTGETCGGTSDADIPNNTFGYGRIDALAAVEAAIALTKAPKQKAQGRGLLAGAFGGFALLSLLGLLGLRIMALPRYVLRTPGVGPQFRH